MTFPLIVKTVVSYTEKPGTEFRASFERSTGQVRFQQSLLGYVIRHRTVTPAQHTQEPPQRFLLLGNQVYELLFCHKCRQADIWLCVVLRRFLRIGLSGKHLPADYEINDAADTYYPYDHSGQQEKHTIFKQPYQKYGNT